MAWIESLPPMACETPESGDEGATPPPFHELIAPFIETASTQLQALFAASGHLAASALPSALNGLRLRLSEIATPVLVAAFRGEVPLPAVARLYDTPPDFAPRQAYEVFVARHGGNLSCWPVLDAKMHDVCADFVHNMALFVRHAGEDAEALSRAEPAWSGGLPQITDIRTGLSDPHAGGRGVIRATFADGRHLAYKPRSLAVEGAFSDLLAAVAQDSAAPDQRRPWVLDQGDHGWMEWIAPAPLATPADAPRFMARCGGLAACLFVLRGGDIHPDNLIPAGAYPVIVDLECLFQPSPSDLGQTDPLDDPHLFASGLLPVFTSFDGGATMVPVAGAGAGPVPQRPESFVRHAGTDWLHLASRPIASFTTGARLGDTVLDVRDHADAFADGFEATLRALWRRRADLLAPGGALERFRTAPCRLLCAPTNLYALVLQGAFGGEAAQNDDAFRARLQRASGRPPLIGPPSVWQAVLQAESETLARLDVPAFTFRPGARDAMSAEGAPLGPVFRQPMYDRVAEALASLEEPTIAATAALVRATLLPAPAGIPAAPDAQHPRYPASDGLSVLGDLADQVADLAIPQGPDAVAWVRLWEQMPAFVAPAGPGFCYGAAGTALFLTEAGRTLDDSRLLGLARKGLEPLRVLIRRGEAVRLAERFGPGYARGIGGMIAGLSWCARLLEDPVMAEDARALAATTPHALAVADTVDVMDGASGLVLGLATLPFIDSRMPMRACGHAILGASRQDEHGRHWPDRRGASLSGLSHGTAGMAVALAHVHAATSEPEWLTEALEACAHEDTQFDPQTGNWHAPGAVGAAHRLSSWCHGAPGIALARSVIGSIAAMSGQTLAGHAPKALATTRTTPVVDVDDLCCGEAGRLEILSSLTAADDGPHQAAIDQAIAARLADWTNGSARLLAARAPGAPADAALFRGLAGLGHLLVRRTTPAFACDVLLPRPLSR